MKKPKIMENNEKPTPRNLIATTQDVSHEQLNNEIPIAKHRS
ncbi:hypothetical protein [uncultured Paraglaciecola sp.]|nr:hypothetical protein [uncultured Paraglaciecola sp.]